MTEVSLPSTTSECGWPHEINLAKSYGWQRPTTLRPVQDPESVNKLSIIVKLGDHPRSLSPDIRAIQMHRKSEAIPKPISFIQPIVEITTTDAKTASTSMFAIDQQFIRIINFADTIAYIMPLIARAWS